MSTFSQQVVMYLHVSCFIATQIAKSNASILQKEITTNEDEIDLNDEDDIVDAQRLQLDRRKYKHVVNGSNIGLNSMR